MTCRTALGGVRRRARADAGRDPAVRGAAVVSRRMPDGVAEGLQKMSLPFFFFYCILAS